MAKKTNSTKKKVPSRDRPLQKEQVFHDRNIPTIKVGIPMPEGAKPPKNNHETDLSPSQPEKSSSEKSSSEKSS